MRRRIFTILALLSLAAAGLVAVGHWHVAGTARGVWLWKASTEFGAHLDKEGLNVVWRAAASGVDDDLDAVELLGFSWGWYVRAERVVHEVNLPFWFLYVTTLILPAWWVWRRYRRKRQLRGFPIEATATSTDSPGQVVG